MKNSEKMLSINFIEEATGLKIEDMPFGCRLCAESIYKQNIIAETENFFSVPDIRSIVTGHVQIISKSHKLDDKFMFSAGHFPTNWFNEYESFIEFMGSCLRQEFGRDAIWFEHGEKEVNPTPGSIYHPHIIGVALGTDIIDKIRDEGEPYFRLEPFNGDLAQLSEVVAGGPYYFYQGLDSTSGDKSRTIMRVKTEKTPSQLIIKYMSEIPGIKKENLEWIALNGVDVKDGEEYLFQKFRPADRFFDSLDRLRKRAALIARNNNMDYDSTEYNSVRLRSDGK